MTPGRLVFLILPFFELLLIWYVASIIGWGWMLLILIGGVVAGFALLRAAGRNVWQVLSDPRRGGQSFTTVDPSTGEATTIYQPGAATGSDEQRQADELKVRESGLLVTAAALLALPGLISDAVGLVLVIPPVRRGLAQRGAARATSNVTVIRGETVAESGPSEREPQSPPDSGGPTIIAGEILPPPDDQQR